MRGIGEGFSRIKKAFFRIHLVDKCLILFMFVLLTQSAYSMFFLIGGDSEASHIDVIVRTASASIFGYFLSANFIRYPSAPKEENASNPSLKVAEKRSSEKEDGVIHGRIGFGINPPEGDVQAGGASGVPSGEKETIPEGRLQIIAATVIGMFCLITLIVLRNAADGTVPTGDYQSAAATVAQFRDFISGCVGFLIGSPTRGSDT